MTLTSAFCRTQEAAQLQRAASEPLENVRQIARTAAKAWNVEAVWAESREKGQVSVPRLRLSAQEQAEDRQESASPNENPDHGLAEA